MINGSNEYFDYLGYSWENILITDSNVGCFVGAKMKSGELVLGGSAGDFLGAEMEGGLIEGKKNAGDYLASSLYGSRAGMKGGTIIIRGNVGKFSCFFMKRGFGNYKGNVDENCCFQMIAGTLIIFKNVKKNLGISMKRGTIILMNNSIKLEKKFVKSGSMNFNFLNLLSNYLRKKSFFNDFKKYKFVRYFGDKNVNGLGEIFLRENYKFETFFSAFINSSIFPFFKYFLNSDFLVAISLTEPARSTSNIFHSSFFFNRR